MVELVEIVVEYVGVELVVILYLCAHGLVNLACGESLL